MKHRVGTKILALACILEAPLWAALMCQQKPEWRIWQSSSWGGIIGQIFNSFEPLVFGLHIVPAAILVLVSWVFWGVHGDPPPAFLIAEAALLYVMQVLVLTFVGKKLYAYVSRHRSK